jgi:hypothetical protein
MRDSAGWLVQISCLYSFAAPSHVLQFLRSYRLDRNRARNVLTQTSSHNQPRNHDLAFTIITKTLIILKRACTSVGHNQPLLLVSRLLFPGCYFLVIVSRLLFLGCYLWVFVSRLLFLGHYSVHPPKRRVVLS